MKKVSTLLLIVCSASAWGMDQSKQDKLHKPKKTIKKKKTSKSLFSDETPLNGGDFAVSFFAKEDPFSSDDEELTNIFFGTPEGSNKNELFNQQPTEAVVVPHITIESQPTSAQKSPFKTIDQMLLQCTSCDRFLLHWVKDQHICKK